MRVLIGMLMAIALVGVFHNAIKKRPVMFYLASVAMAIGYLYGVMYGLPAWLWKSAMFLMQKNILAFSLLTIVMFLGALPDDSLIRRKLMPIRGELSIMTCLLSIGHVAVFGFTYVRRMLGDGQAPSPDVVFATIAALLALSMMIPLLVTSFRGIRNRMNARTWKAVQMLAYPFFLLIFIHLFLYIGAPSLQGGGTSMLNLLVYGTVLLAYLCLRIKKACAAYSAARG